MSEYTKRSFFAWCISVSFGMGIYFLTITATAFKIGIWILSFHIVTLLWAFSAYDWAKQFSDEEMTYP